MKQIFIVFFLLQFIFQTKGNSRQFEYLFPIPGSEMHSKFTDLIIRPGYPIQSFDLGLLKNTTITGNKSGDHNYIIQLLENKTTAVLEFELPFEPGEEVHVVFDQRLLNVESNPIGEFHYKFKISAFKKYTEAFILPEKKDLVYPEKDLDTLPPDFLQLIFKFPEFHMMQKYF